MVKIAIAKSNKLPIFANFVCLTKNPREKEEESTNSRGIFCRRKAKFSEKSLFPFVFLPKISLYFYFKASFLQRKSILLLEKRKKTVNFTVFC